MNGSCYELMFLLDCMGIALPVLRDCTVQTFRISELNDVVLSIHRLKGTSIL